ncbi:MAG: hypothetical protein DI629_20720 [Mesorhizobium amorphae]|nr:MAG: hypothetical protein DI629_20720 [Mesorhizobium amorphae]
MKITITHGISLPETAGELEDHQIQERAAADIASLSGSESLMDGLAELLDDESIDGLLAAAERVRRSRDQDPRP